MPQQNPNDPQYQYVGQAAPLKFPSALPLVVSSAPVDFASPYLNPNFYNWFYARALQPAAQAAPPARKPAAPATPAAKPKPAVRQKKTQAAPRPPALPAPPVTQTPPPAPVPQPTPSPQPTPVPQRAPSPQPTSAPNPFMSIPGMNAFAMAATQLQQVMDAAADSITPPPSVTRKLRTLYDAIFGNDDDAPPTAPESTPPAMPAAEPITIVPPARAAAPRTPIFTAASEAALRRG